MLDNKIIENFVNVREYLNNNYDELKELAEEEGITDFTDTLDNFDCCGYDTEEILEFDAYVGCSNYYQGSKAYKYYEEVNNKILDNSLTENEKIQLIYNICSYSDLLLDLMDRYILIGDQSDLFEYYKENYFSEEVKQFISENEEFMDTREIAKNIYQYDTRDGYWTTFELNGYYYLDTLYS